VGCSGFQYSMAFEIRPGDGQGISFEDLKVFVDGNLADVLNGCTVDYVETLEAADSNSRIPR